MLRGFFLRVLLLFLVLLPQAPAFAAYLGNLSAPPLQEPAFSSDLLLTETADAPVYLVVFEVEGDLYYGFIANNDPINGIDVLGLFDMPLFLTGQFWKDTGHNIATDSIWTDFTSWREKKIVDSSEVYARIIVGELNVGGIVREGVPAMHEQAVEHTAAKIEYRTDELGMSFGYAVFQSAISDPILQTTGAKAAMESIAGYDSLTGETLSKYDRSERAGLALFQLGSTGMILSGAYNPNASFSTSLSSFKYTGLGTDGFRTWATTYKPTLTKEWVTTFRINNHSPILWQHSKSTPIAFTDDLAITPLSQNITGLSDDTLVHFGPEGYSVVKPGAGGEVFSFRYGDIKHLTPRYIESVIGDLAGSGVKGGAKVMHVLDEVMGNALQAPGGVLYELPEYIFTKPVKVKGGYIIQ